MLNFKKDKHRVRRSVNPTNHVKRGVRQVLFPYEFYKVLDNLNLSVFLHNLLNDKKIRIIAKSNLSWIYGV